MQEHRDVAVHRRPSGADTRPLPEGGLQTLVLSAPGTAVEHLSAARLLIPGGKHLPPRLHHADETALVLLSGYAAVLSGTGMHPVRPAPGDLVYVRQNLPYTVANLSRNAAILMLVVSTDPSFDGASRRAPEFDSLAAGHIEQLRIEHARRLAQQHTGNPRRSR
jgi:uncharacterized RmlC-like cupin family protein